MRIVRAILVSTLSAGVVFSLLELLNLAVFDQWDRNQSTVSLSVAHTVLVLGPTLAVATLPGVVVGFVLIWRTDWVRMTPIGVLDIGMCITGAAPSLAVEGLNLVSEVGRARFGWSVPALLGTWVYVIGPAIMTVLVLTRLRARAAVLGAETVTAGSPPDR